MSSETFYEWARVLILAILFAVFILFLSMAYYVRSSK